MEYDWDKKSPANTNNTELMKIISQNLLNTMKRISTFFRLHVHFERKRINTGY
jgi:hypothetical protein